MNTNTTTSTAPRYQLMHYHTGDSTKQPTILETGTFVQMFAALQREAHSYYSSRYVVRWSNRNRRVDFYLNGKGLFALYVEKMEA